MITETIDQIEIVAGIGGILAIAAGVWRGVTWLSNLRKDLEKLETNLEHLRELLEAKDEAILAELKDHKDSTTRNFSKLYDLVRNGPKT